MKVITLLNEKGGVGKTTLAVHIAAGLAIRGYRVLLIDADPQAHSTQWLRLPETGGLYHLLVNQAAWNDVLLTPNEACWSTNADTGKLLVLPGDVQTRNIPNVINDVECLRSRLASLTSQIDVVVIDTAPTPSMLQALISFATDMILYPTLPDSLSIAALQKSVAHMAAIPTLGIQPTMVRSGTALHKAGMNALHSPGTWQDILEFHPTVWEPIALRTVWPEAGWARETLYVYEPDGEAAREAWRLVGRVMEGLGLDAT